MIFLGVPTYNPIIVVPTKNGILTYHRTEQKRGVGLVLTVNFYPRSMNVIVIIHIFTITLITRVRLIFHE